MLDPNLIAYLLAMAIRLSGLPGVAVDELPRIEILSGEALASQVCPEDARKCAAIAAQFDAESYRILVRDTLDLDDARGQSFVVHELVHVLQYRSQGGSMFETCEAALQSERAAYRTQNRFLAAMGKFGREGAALAHMQCAATQPVSVRNGGVGAEMRLEPVRNAY
ncbi:MAG: hypothetical protein JNJ60_07670 [Rhodocyclaceae bacterium]|nr:hypothetical protein [Rhodocyclaceae bacterium]